MTTQFEERLLLDGVVVPLHSRPLNGYPGGKFDPLRNTALRRGYRGTWALRADRLYLVMLEGYAEGGGDVRLWDLFPDADPRGVLADWYTGPLCVPRGEMVAHYADGKRRMVYPWELRFTVEAGVVTDRQMVKCDFSLSRT